MIELHNDLKKNFKDESSELARGDFFHVFRHFFQAEAIRLVCVQWKQEVSWGSYLSFCCTMYFVCLFFFLLLDLILNFILLFLVKSEDSSEDLGIIRSL